MAERPAFWRATVAGGTVLRALVAPASLLYGLVMRVRNWRYDRQPALVVRPLCPTVSVGNLSVGGTGKTPVTAWIADQIAAAGVRPGIVLRGVGGDEPQVLERLVPSALVVADPDRVRGSAAAVAAGADVIVLDDAFQHRRAGRTWDIVLVSADSADEVDRVLPAGPLREPLEGLRRAGLVVITRKAASDADVAAMESRVCRVAPDAAIAVVSLLADAVHTWHGRVAGPVSGLAGRTIAAVSGIGDPRAFERQLVAAGAQVTGFRFGDHHAYTDADVADLLQRIPAGADVVCTLKDAVKLGPRWPDHGPPLWYLSQRIIVDRGDVLLAAGIRQLVRGVVPRSPADGRPPSTSL